jgi:hypothetical protein
MRNIMTSTELQMAAGLLAVLLFLLVFLQPRPQMWFYPLAREAAKAKMNYEAREMLEIQTEHFVIKYTENDAKDVDMVARAAEAAYKPVTSILGYPMKNKALIVIYPDKAELRKFFGWSGNESAMGVYWGGAIQLLSPSQWLKEGDSVDKFIQTGPMVHEFTHMVFDYMTNGNYPRWFTEGLAQYVEYQVNDYEWLTSENSLAGKTYSMAELDNDFDELPNQSLAYRESLAAVRYIAEVHGKDKLQAVIAGLKAGQDMPKVISNVLGMDYASYEKAWQTWAEENMQNS